MKYYKFMIALIFVSTLPNAVNAQITYTDWWGIEYVKNEKESLRDYVQNCCSFLLGKSFAEFNSNDRNALYDRIIDELLHTSFYGQKQLEKHYVDSITHKWLIDLTGRCAYNYALQNGLTIIQSKSIQEKMKEHVNTKVRWSVHYTHDKKFGLSQGFFEQFLNPSSLMQYVISIKYETERNQYWNEIVEQALNFLFGYTNQESFENPCPQVQPTAPIPNLDQTQIQKPTRLYPTEECAANCFTNFKNDGENRIFLPCGHNFCKGCIENWFFTHKNNTCPQCRSTLSTAERVKLRTVLNDQLNFCAGCNNSDNNARTLNCYHKLCINCQAAWKNENNEFKNECPRCSSRFNYL